MKTTGMVRRIDELGRIVIPKEIRKQLMMKEGESIAFALEDDKIILTKFSSLNKVSPIIESLLERLYQKYHNSFLMSDMHHIIMSSSSSLSLYQRKELPKDLLLLLQQNRMIIEEMIDFAGETRKVTALPLQLEMQCIGALMMISEQTPYYMVDETLLEFVKNVIEQELEACV